MRVACLAVKGQGSRCGGAAAADGVELTSDVIICGRCKRSFVDGRHLAEHKRTSTCRPCCCRRRDDVSDSSSHVTGEVRCYTWGEVTSRNLWSRYVRHFVGITWHWHDVLSNLIGEDLPCYLNEI